MSRRPFTQRSVTAALRGITNAGLNLRTVKVDPITGAVVVTVGNAPAADIEGDGDADQKTIDAMIKRYRNQHSHEKKS